MTQAIAVLRAIALGEPSALRRAAELADAVLLAAESDRVAAEPREVAR